MTTTPNKNIAARAGAWSARNRKKAIFGWLAFVLIALFVGGSLGQRAIGDDEQNTGDSARAEKILSDAFPEGGASEQVLVQARGEARAAAIRDVQRTLAQARGITDIEKPQLSKDGFSAVIGFEIATEDDDKAQEVVAPIEAAIAKVAARHPDARVEQFGEASGRRCTTA